MTHETENHIVIASTIATLAEAQPALAALSEALETIVDILLEIQRGDDPSLAAATVDKMARGYRAMSALGSFDFGRVNAALQTIVPIVAEHFGVEPD